MSLVQKGPLVRFIHIIIILTTYRLSEMVLYFRNRHASPVLNYTYFSSNLNFNRGTLSTIMRSNEYKTLGKIIIDKSHGHVALAATSSSY